MTTRILAVDPGLTRCGIGVIDVDARRRVSLVHVEIVRSAPDAPLEQRLGEIGAGVERALDEHAPHRVALERVFAQHNVRTVMGTAQVSGVVLYAASRRGLAVALHTPSEVKAAVTGYGAAEKAQVDAAKSGKAKFGGRPFFDKSGGGKSGLGKPRREGDDRPSGPRKSKNDADRRR